MRTWLALAVVVGGCAALVACSGVADAGGAGLGDDGGAEAAPPPDASYPVWHDAGVSGGRSDAGSGFDAAVDIDAAGSVKARWNKACWEVANGTQYQAIHFDVTTPAPVTLVGTLFLAPGCDPSKGTVVNNNIATVSSGSYAYWFNDHPNDPNTSATWSLGDATSGCVDYQHAPTCH